MTDPTPRVSVLVVSFNHERCIRAALDSIEGQRFDGAVEVVVADDASEDGTLDVVRDWAESSQLIVRILPMQPRLGITLNYARGFAACLGEYVAVLEGDDEWILDSKLRLQVDALDRNAHVSMVANRLELFDESTGVAHVEPLIGMTSWELEVASERIADTNWFATFSTCMFRRAALELVPPAVFEMLAYDWALSMAVTEFGPALFLPQIAVSYRVHGTGTWSQQSDVQRDRQLQLLIPQYIAAFDGRLSRELHRSLIAVERRLAAAPAATSTREPEDTAGLGRAPRPSVVPRRIWAGEDRADLVSVIVPCFNHAGYIGRALDSILEQTHQNFEIIVVDDASSDASLKVVDAYADPRIRVIRLPRNVGGASALNIGIQQARGEYVALLNSDDMWAAEKLAQQLEVLRDEPATSAVFTAARFVGVDDLPLEPTQLPPWGEVFRQPDRSRSQWLRLFFDRGNVLCHPSMLIRRSAYRDVGLYDNRLRQLPDFDKWISLLSHSAIRVLGDQPLVLFRLLPDNANTSSVTPATVRRSMREHLWISADFLDRLSDEMLIEGFGDLLDEPTIGPGLERECDIAIIYLRASGPLQSINREVGLSRVMKLLADPAARLILATKYGIDDKTVHDRAGLQELALTAEIENAVSDSTRPVVVDLNLPTWPTGALVRLVMSRARSVPLRDWPSRAVHHVRDRRMR